MGLDSALSIANGGLANINAQFALLSHNVANAATPGYAVEVGGQQSLTANGMGLGVRTTPARLQLDQVLQSSAMQQNATVAGLQTTQASLQAIDSVLGTPGSGNDIGSLLGNLKNSFSTLLTDPSSQPRQNAVVIAATSLTNGINALSATYSAQRQAAQNNLGSAITTLNSTLETIGQLSNQIIALKPTNQSTADLENQRNGQVQALSQLLNIKTIEQQSGDLSIFTSSGLTLPTRASVTPFSMANASTSPQSYYSAAPPGGGIPGIELDGVDITNQMVGGQIGAGITLRDNTLPTGQAELDEFSQGLSSRFDSQGLRLFTDPNKNVPAVGVPPLMQVDYVGYAGTIQVNSDVTDDPSLVRDGTNALASPNPAGFTALISSVINNTFGTPALSGALPMSTQNLGPGGNLSAPFNAISDTLSNFATNLVSSQAQHSAETTARLDNEQALQTSLNAKITSVSGVNMDTELSQMLQLQNAYGANARVLSAVHSMFTQLLQAIQ